jgi:hypothetical protein
MQTRHTHFGLIASLLFVACSTTMPGDKVVTARTQEPQTNVCPSCGTTEIKFPKPVLEARPMVPTTPLYGDIDGDGSDDPIEWQGMPSTTFPQPITSVPYRWVWRSVARPSSPGGIIEFGRGGDIPLVGDLDGDRRDDLVLWRGGLWIVRPSSGAAEWSLAWGSPTLRDVPLLADLDGDRRDDLIIWRPDNDGTGNAQWYPLLSSKNYAWSGGPRFGRSTNIPLLGDFNGDRQTDYAVWGRQGSNSYASFILRLTPLFNNQQVNWGSESLGDRPIVADFDGDGRTDLSVWRPNNDGNGNGQWYPLLSSNGYAWAGGPTMGTSSDRPLAGDFNGDGRADYVVWNDTKWVLRMQPPIPN